MPMFGITHRANSAHTAPTIQINNTSLGEPKSPAETRCRKDMVPIMFDTTSAVAL